VIDQDRSFKTLKEKFAVLEIDYKWDSELKIKFERELAVEKVQKEFQNKAVLEANSELSKLRVKIEEYELTKKLQEVETSKLREEISMKSAEISVLASKLKHVEDENNEYEKKFVSIETH